jgi:ubiquinone/menaquinone biosynthesis C-methylase UbiE
MAMVDYDKMASSYDAGRSLSAPTINLWLDVFAPHLEGVRAPLIDVGSGTGRFSTAIAERFGLPVAGVEPSAGMRDAAREQSGHERVSFVGGDAQALPLRDASCGAALLSTMIHHVPDLALAARELRRALAPEAPVLVRSWFPNQGDVLPQFRYFPAGLEIANKFPTVEATEAAFAAAGFGKQSFQSVPQTSAGSLREFLERIRTRADTTLSLLSDDEWERGLAQLEADAEAETSPQPVMTYLYLLVLR